VTNDDPSAATQGTKPPMTKAQARIMLLQILGNNVTPLVDVLTASAAQSDGDLGKALTAARNDLVRLERHLTGALGYLQDQAT